MPNTGQIPNLPLGAVVETNAYFRRDDVKPIFSGNMPSVIAEMTKRHILTHSLLLKAFDEKKLDYALDAMKNDPSIEHLSSVQIEDMFHEIVPKMGKYLSYYEVEK
jgi:alpha-galactosidase